MNAQIPKDEAGWTEILLRCGCQDNGHIISVGYFDNEPALYVDVVAIDPNFPLWKRIWQATKLVFGRRSRDRANVVLERKDVVHLRDFCEEFLYPDTWPEYKTNTSNDVEDK